MLSKVIFSLCIILSCSVQGACVSSVAINEHDFLPKFFNFSQGDTSRLVSLYRETERNNTDSIPFLIQLCKKMHACRMTAYEIKILKRIGDIWSMRCNRENARNAYENAMWLAEANGMSKELIDIIAVLHSFHASANEEQKTLYYIMKGIRTSDRAGDLTSLIEFYSRLALFYRASGDYERALSMQMKVLKICRELKFDYGIVCMLVDIGTTYMKMDQYEKGMPYYLGTRNYIGLLKGTVHVVEVCCAVSEGYRLQKKFDSAAYYVQKAYDFASELNHPKAKASALVIKGWLANELGNYREAENYAAQAMKLVKQSGFNAQLPSLYLLLKNIYTHQGKYKRALEVYEMYLKEKNILSKEEIRKEAAQKEYAYRLEKKEHEYLLLKQQKEIQDLESKYIYTGIGGGLFILLAMTWFFVRQRKLRTEHMRIQLEQKLLRAQMNPHFMFNSLNSIQQFVMEKRAEKAELYLFKFSTLMRSLLESNLKDSLSVGEEITMLNTYLEMEALRFGSRFSYSIEVDEHINQVNIPHLMLQPFVENAIWHGLLPKKGDRSLQVCLQYHTPETIRCTIDDNGVGRMTGEKIPEMPGKKSLALQFVNQRIMLIKRTHGIQGSVDIIDKKDQAGMPCGTKVVIVLPIFKN